MLATLANRSLTALLFGIFITHAGWYLVVPFLAIVLTSQRGLNPAQVGMVLAAQSIALVGASLIGGWLADRMGGKGALLLGIALRGAGLAALGLVTGLPALVAAAAIAGVGIGIYGPAAKAGIAAEASTEEKRTTAFSLRGIAANLGVTLGPVAGALLLRRPMAEMFLWSGGLHAVLLAVTALWLAPGCRPGTAGCDAVKPAPVLTFLKDRPFVLFSIATVVLWALFSQVLLAVPLHAQRVLADARGVGVLWTGGSITVILLQVPVARLVLSRVSPTKAMAAGAVLLGLGLAAVGLARSLWGLAGAYLIFVVGQMLVLPTSDAVVSALARPETMGAYFGISAFAWGMGEALGGVTAGQLFSRFGGTAVPWVIYAVTGAGLGLAFAALRLQGAQAAVPERKVGVDRQVLTVEREEPAEHGARLGGGGRPEE